jgi:hypothetical protein
MPYEIMKIGDQYVVRNKKTKRVLGKHPTRAKALQQLAAVEINTSSETQTEKGNQPITPGVLIRNAQGHLETASPHQARRLFLSSVPLELSQPSQPNQPNQGRRVEVRRTKGTLP